MMRVRSVMYAVSLRKLRGVCWYCLCYTTSQLNCLLLERFRNPEAHTFFQELEWKTIGLLSNRAWLIDFFRCGDILALAEVVR